MNVFMNMQIELIKMKEEVHTHTLDLYIHGWVQSENISAHINNIYIFIKYVIILLLYII